MRNPDDPSALGWLAYRYFHAPIGALRQRNADFLLFLLLGGKVRSGPFEGMRYVGSSPNGHFGKELLGTMELEIIPFVRRLLVGDHDVFINIGAAEGYYAVGFALRSAIPKVIAYEGNRFGRILVRHMARRNGVAAKIETLGYCEADELARVMSPYQRPALLVDIEGYEAKVLDPAVNPHLARATLLVELHEWDAPVADILRARFEATHSIEEIWDRPRGAADIPAVPFWVRWVFPLARLLQFADERRGRPMRWWLLNPKPRPSAPAGAGK